MLFEQILQIIEIKIIKYLLKEEPKNEKTIIEL